MKKHYSRFLAISLAAVMLLGGLVASAVGQAETGTDVNLARLNGVKIKASDTETDTYPASAAIDGNKEDTSRWGTSNDASGKGTTKRTLELDLGAKRIITGFKVFWEKTNILEYTIDTSNDGTNWETRATATRTAGQREDEHSLTIPVVAQHVRLSVTKYGQAVANWYNVGVREFEVYGEDPAKVTVGNLSRVPGVVATADDTETNQFPASAAIDGNYNADSRWGSNNDGKGTTKRTLSLNLGAPRTVTGFKVFWEKTNILEYTIETSNDAQNWDAQETVVRTEGKLQDEYTLETPVIAQYVRLSVTKYGQSVTNWFNVGVREFEVYGHMPQDDDALVTLPERTNLAVQSGVTASATNYESGTAFTADKARDGIKGDRQSRWATDRDVKSPTITYNLGAKYMVGSVILYWESNNPDEWYVETSMDGRHWDVQKKFEGKLPLRTAPVQTVNFDAPVEARYVRVRVEQYSSESWNNVSLYEFEVYQEESEVIVTPAAAAAELAQSIRLENGRVSMTAAVPEKYTAIWGCNYEQVVSADGTVHTPLVNTKVEITVTVREKADTTKSGSAKVELTIPGVKSANEGNVKPAVVPELAQWYSSAEQQGKLFRLTADSRIVTEESMHSVAVELQKDIKDRFGLTLPIVPYGAKAGDISLTYLNGDGFDKETYNMVVTDQVVIQANDNVGAYWGTRSVMQALVLSGNQTIVQGTARDYPEFETRGFMLDVGRKPMSMEMLRNFAKNMAWFKFNDMHIHLSDNLIFMEDYVNAGKRDEAWNSYQGYRLESDKKGLTSKDYFYTKAEFKSFIEDCRALGVNITPEIDVPAHALSITNYIKHTLNRPDLVLNKIGNGNRPWFDHVDISKPEAIEIVKDIFDEYIDENIFDENTVVHIGADEFYDSHPAYRNFLIQMIDYIRNEKGRDVRIWGSLSSMSNHPDQHPFKPEHVQGAQMNIWNTGWANPQAMFDLGFDIINTVDGSLYIVPSGNGSQGGYGDFLNSQNLYDNWEPENVGGTWLPTGSTQMMGATFAIWQDNIDTHATGINETDTFHRFMEALPYLSVKMWGTGGDGLDRNFNDAKANVKLLSTAPNTNPYHVIKLAEGTQEYAQYSFADTFDRSGNGRDLVLNGASIVDGALVLNGKASYAVTGLDAMGPNSTLTMRVFKDGSDQKGEQILFEADAPYGEHTIKAIPTGNGTWKVGFARELYEYVFDYELPHDQWVELTIRNEGDKTYLLVDGQKIAAVGSFLPDEHATTQFMGKTGIERSPLDIPVGRIGSTTNSFHGKVDSVMLYANNVTATERFQVRFDSLGGSAVDSVIVVNGEAVAQPEAPVKAGAVFGGWFTDAACTSAYDFTAPVEGDLTLYAKWIPVDKSVLEEAVAKAESMLPYQEQYFQNNWQQLLDALNSAKNVLTDKNATAEDVQYAAEVLLNAIDAQKRKADKSALKDLIAKAEGMDLTGYTAESVENFKTALEAAKAVMANEDLGEDDQAVVDEAAAQLDAAIKSLIAEPAPKPDPEKPEPTPDPEKPTPTPDPEKPEPPKTGDNSIVMMWAAVAMASLAGVSCAAVAMLNPRKRRSI